LKKSANLQHSLIISLLLVADGWQMWQILADLSIVWSEGDYIMVFWRPHVGPRETKCWYGQYHSLVRRVPNCGIVL